MTTKELIQKLQELDPEGDLNVMMICVEHAEEEPILEIRKEEYYSPKGKYYIALLHYDIPE